MKVLGLDHIVINVTDLDESLKFYGEVLALEVLRLDQFRRGQVGFPSLRVSADTIIDLRPVESASDVGANVDHFCLVVESAKMEALREELMADGVAVHSSVGSRWGAGGDGMAFTISDPDGNKIELKSYGR
jgi:catechol 2,3-dioxygenase-like lactoylglutathione lyase family enzyme